MPVCGATSEHYRPPSACLKPIQEPARGRVRLICVISQAFRAPAIAMCVVVVLLSACSSQGASVPELTPDVEAGLAADALASACAGACDGFNLYVRDQLITIDTFVGEADPMPQSTMDAVRQRLGDVTFVGQEQADALFGDDTLVEGGRGVLLSMGPAEKLADGVVGIEVGVTNALDGGHGQVLQFQWNGETWIPATSDETGVTVTSWVS